MAANNRYKKSDVPTVQGFGESKIFAAPEGSFPKAEGEIDLLDCHVAGIPVRDLPRDNQLRLLYQQTDEGMAWWDANKHKLENRDGHVGPQGRGNRVAGLGEALDAEDKKLLKYRDELSDFDGLRLAEDPFAEAMREHTPVGHKGLFMSPRQCKEKGMVRGPLKYERVLVKNKHTGVMEPVEVGGMFLASVPIALYEKSERFHAAVNREKQISTQDRVRQQAEQIMSEAGLRDLAKKKRVLDDLVGFEQESGDAAEHDLAHSFE